MIGSGGAAFAATIEASRHDARAVLIERPAVGGTCVNVGCVRSKTLLAAAHTYHHAASHPCAGVPTQVGPVDLAALIAQKDELIADMWQHKYVDLADHYGFEIIHELARFKDRDTLAVGRRGLQATLNVVATGADPAIPSVSGVREAGYLTSTTAVEQASVPKRLITIGGGFVGLEQSRLFARLGADVTIIGRLAPWAEPELASRPRHILMDEGIRVINARATSVEVHGDTRVVHTNRETASEDDAIMVATDRQARIDARDLTAAGVELDNRGSSKSLIRSAHPTTGSSRPATSPVVRRSLISSAMTLRSLLRAFLVVSLVAVSALVATVAPPLAAVAGAATESCATPVTSAPAGPATVSAASTAYGQVLVVGSGATSGGSLYVLNSDSFQAVSGVFACTNAGVPPACDTSVWPALLTAGSPVAGPGVNPTLLGTVTRTDVLTGTTVQQVTYAGHPLYRFFLDSVPGNTAGEGLFDPFVSPPGVWHLVSPPEAGRPFQQPRLNRGRSPSPGSARRPRCSRRSWTKDWAFPVYTFSADSFPRSTCQFPCEIFWPPLLTVGRPLAGSGVDPGTLGIIVRPDGTHQVTFQGHPLYLFVRDARFPGTPAVANGAGITAFGGTFQTVPPR